MDPTEVRQLQRKVQRLRAQQNDVNVEMAEAEKAERTAREDRIKAERAEKPAEVTRLLKEEKQAKADAEKFRKRSNELAGQIARVTAQLPRGAR